VPKSEGKTRLGIGKAVITSFPLKSGIAGVFSILEAAKEARKGFVQPPQDILQDLAVDVLVGRKCHFNLGQFSGLLVMPARARPGAEGPAVLVSGFPVEHEVVLVLCPRVVRSSHTSILSEPAEMVCI
jgi:hypothetical protein